MGFCCFGNPSTQSSSHAQFVSQKPAPKFLESTPIPEIATDIPENKTLSSIISFPELKSEAEGLIISTETSMVSKPDFPGLLPPWLREPSISSAGGQEKENQDNSNYSSMINDVLKTHLSEVKLILQRLACLSNTPTIAINEAAELLCKHLGTSLCSITSISDHFSSFILLSSYGIGVQELERYPVMRGENWSAAHLLQRTAHLYYSIHNDKEAEVLPHDFKALYRLGMRSFLCLPINTETEILGVLTLVKKEVDAFEGEWWDPFLSCVAVGLVQYLRSDQTQLLCQLMRALDSSPDYTNLINNLLRGSHNLLLKATNIRTGCRFALLGHDLNKALVFEPDLSVGQSKSKSSSQDPYGAQSPQSPVGAQLHVTEVSLENTLLLDAVQKGKARFVSDCASYIQSCMKPATDIFISRHEMVASIVVLPLIFDEVTFGGFYVTLETTSNFQNIKDLLMGLVSSVVVVLSQRLESQRTSIWDSVMAKPAVAAAATEEGSVGGEKKRSTAGAGMSEDPAASGGSGGGERGLGAEVPSTGVAGAVPTGGISGSAEGSSVAGNKPLVMKRTCTEAMLKVLQNELRRTHAKNSSVEWMDELVLHEVAGKGGFGIVYKGTWKGSVAAIKVMYARQHERQAMKDALEMAVLTTVSHPHIIQVFSCFTDMVEDAGGSGNLLGSPTTSDNKLNVRFRRLQPDEDSSLATCSILVMEYCDRASLRHAMKKGAFHKRLSSTSVAVDLCAIVQVLIEVAQAIQHLHSLKLIHCDIKPENVLLKSDGTKSIGFVTKLSDFGLAKLLRENYYIVNRSGSGTVTHLAPELFQVGSKLTTSVDTFSFGIMMWELYTGQRAYSGMGREQIIDRVYKRKGRPSFPAGVPQPYVTMAKSCWDNDPSQRPTFIVILQKLTEMLTLFQSSCPVAAPTPAPVSPSPQPQPALSRVTPQSP
eukprot:CAMPEP_0175058822 /NCGR_PEP_ID=MMETSP0052_2-20121109/12069_1 /TAXON_ID=51329 ORGANISM="Polytomella parva, Strain SAG 63-3" /NCGR_SAMPLE_ID=MMETSP0052_2 /ASSEMBLY_ACC=CAM_ASM_000194 /LENGTH=934 /DNA_ID=CAMNT_0016324261 /DNA_START=67 /DNA_END=2867 /DNA_ORIENTATION=-